jgi:hypothetical protein
MTAAAALAPVCRHCERRPAGDNKLGLCERCHRVRGIRRLYRPRDAYPPWWEEHLRRLAARARRRLPLFPE